MELTLTTTPTHTVVTAAGRFTDAETVELRRRLVDAVGRSTGDVVVDVRAVTSFDDGCLAAFTGARSRAKFLRRRLAVVDADGGAVSLALRRSGLHARIGSYPDVDAARAGLVEGRAARARLTLHLGTLDEALDEGRGAPSDESRARRPAGERTPALANPVRHVVA